MGVCRFVFFVFVFSVGRCVLHALDFEPQKPNEIPRIRHSSGCKSAKECGKTNNNKKTLAVNLPKSVGIPTTTKKPVCRDFDFDPKKSVRKTKEIPRIRHRSACKFPKKKCGKITNKKVCRVFDFEKKKNVKKTKEIPRIRHRSACKFMAKKVRKNPKIKRLITFFPQILLFWPVGRPRVVSVCSTVDSDPRAVR